MQVLGCLDTYKYNSSMPMVVATRAGKIYMCHKIVYTAVHMTRIRFFVIEKCPYTSAV